MLQKLFVQNYALIDNLEIEFQNGLTVITGETGAGKSILLGALALALGARADKDSLRDKNKKCIVEILFDIKKLSLKGFFEENDLDFESQTVIRREITPNGKSRAFINDTPVNLTQVKNLGDKLIDIHSQHENLELNQHEFQISILDTIGNNLENLQQFQLNHIEYLDLLRKINLLREKNTERKQRIDFIQFQYEELKNAKLKTAEQAELEQEQNRLSNSEEIAENLNVAIKRFSREDYNIIDELSSAKQEIDKISSYFENGEDLVNRLQTALIDLTDLSQDLIDKIELIQFDPDRLEMINKRLNLIYTLQQKHNANSIDDLLEVQNELEDEINAIESFEDDLEILEKKTQSQLEKIKIQAEELHKNRLKAAKDSAKIINTQLNDLGMESSLFIIDVQKSGEINKFGQSQISFNYAADQTSTPKPITKIASGGELSRIMLIIKSILANKKSLPSIIFDEIDTGVSGEIANKMGQIMRNMALKMQLIAITHLPQIAAKGDYHNIVYKEQENTGAQTRIKNIKDTERINVIAQMLSTDKPGEAAIANAKELLSS